MDNRKYVVAARLVALAGVWFAGRAGAAVVYSNTFESGSSLSGWSIQRTSVTPTGRGFLGEFGNETPRLSLGDLGEHTAITVSFDLFIIRSWDGNNTTPGVGPDVWSMGYDKSEGEQALLTTTFANQPAAWTRPQAYPSAFGFADNSMNAGASEVNTLGYFHREWALSAVYRMQFTFPHSDPSVSVWFRASGLQGLSDESWGLDNVVVSVIPAPGALALAGLGAMLMLRRKR